jgi:putative phosphoesterase
MKRIGLISDTHGYLDEKVFKYFAECDEIWHAGDIGNIEVADQLAAFKPFRAVYGNIDGMPHRTMFPETLRFKCEEMEIMMTHIGGRPYVYPPAVRAAFKERSPDIFICGHSHILRVEFDKRQKVLYLNPGAAGIHGFHKVKTLLRFSIEGKKISNMEAIELGPRALSKAEKEALLRGGEEMGGD